MIKAINKAGMISEFTEKVWELMSPSKNGFVELSDIPIQPKIPQGIIEFKAKKLEEKQAPQETQEEKIVVEVKANKGDAAAEMDIMREFLKEKGIKVSHLMGYDKLKAIYDENRE
jgi:hypothetical protein